MALAGVRSGAFADVVPRDPLDPPLADALGDLLAQRSVERLPGGLPEFDPVVLGRVVRSGHHHAGVGALPGDGAADRRRGDDAQVDDVGAGLAESGGQGVDEKAAALAGVAADHDPVGVDGQRLPHRERQIRGHLVTDRSSDTASSEHTGASRDSLKKSARTGARVVVRRSLSVARLPRGLLSVSVRAVSSGVTAVGTLPGSVLEGDRGRTLGTLRHDGGRLLVGCHYRMENARTI